MRITGAVVYDPANEVDGLRRDIGISGDRITASGGGGETIDGSGCIAMAGGMDIHAHVISSGRYAGSTVGTTGGAYDSAKTVRAMLGQGITCFVEPGLSAKDAVLSDNIGSDIDFFLLLLETGRCSGEVADRFLTRKYVGREGVELFLAGNAEPAVPPHIHLPDLGKPGSIRTLESFLEKLEGRRCHLSHVAYYIFDSLNGRLYPRPSEAACMLAEHPNVTFDLGPPVFGKALTLTVDGELFGRISGQAEPELSAGSPYLSAEYVFSKNRFHDAVFWLAGMELLLELRDLPSVSLSIDYPSGGSIEGYPGIISRLMSKKARDDYARELNPEALAVSGLLSNGREYSFYETARITRTSPARALRRNDRGHLGLGAVADIVLYRPPRAGELTGNEIERMFANPALVVKSGRIIYRNGNPA